MMAARVILLGALGLWSLGSATASSAKTGAAMGAPSAGTIRNALVYERTYGVVTGADAMGMVQRSVDYDAGLSRTTMFGMTVDQYYSVKNEKCQLRRPNEYACQFDLTVRSNLGPSMTTRGNHVFVRRGAYWRSPSYQAALIASSNRSAANQPQRNCTVQGFGTLEGPHLADSQGLRC